jgi:hypothetical protein
LSAASAARTLDDMNHRRRGPAPTKHQLTLMIWVAVSPTLTALNLLLDNVVADLPSVARTFVLATVAVRSSAMA